MWLFERVVSTRGAIDAEVDATPPRHRRPPGAVHVLHGPAEAHSGRSGCRPRHLDDSLAFLRECLAEAIQAQRPGRPPRAGAARARAEPRPRPRRSSCAASAESELAARPEPLRGLVRVGALGAGAAARARPRRTSPSRGKIDRIDRRPVRGARDRVRTTSRARRRTRRREIERSSACRSRSTCSCCATSSGIEPLGGLYRALAGDAQGPRPALRSDRREDGVPGFQKNDYLDEDAFWAQVDRRRSGARDSRSAASARATSSTTRRAASRARRGASLWTMCRVKRS